ncbi:MAG: Ig-like domain-containing protein [Deltaproteobacteria bacterium]|nr:Ig-like domain-containing protein [Deltaproteobacteria bacterium]
MKRYFIIIIASLIFSAFNSCSSGVTIAVPGAGIAPNSNAPSVDNSAVSESGSESIGETTPAVNDSSSGIESVNNTEPGVNAEIPGTNNASSDTLLFIPPTIAKAINGGIQKGPFIKGSTVHVQELNANFDPIGTFFSLYTHDDLGNFRLSDTITHDYIEVISQGYYFNEITNSISPSNLTLRVISDISENRRVMVNSLTTLDRERIEHLINHPGELTVNSESTVFKNARKQAEDEILKDVFNIYETELMTFDQMDISSAGKSNAILLAVSLILQGDNSVGELSELISMISTDIEKDGTLDNEEAREELTKNATCLNPTSIRENLEKRYKFLSANDAVVPWFEAYIDSDGDGQINLYDQQPPTVIAVLPEAEDNQVSILTPVKVTFSEHVDAGLITNRTFTLKDEDHNPIEGGVSYDCRTKTAVFLPRRPLEVEMTYTAVVSADISDGAGLTMEDDYEWEFTTLGEVCDGIDNDNDNDTDEDLVRGVTCGVGQCAGTTGTETCEDGEWVDNTCNAANGATSEVCDNADNDCDGKTDEDLVRETTCGEGVCAINKGSEQCTFGVWIGDTCRALEGATTEVCDYADNDCDGLVDEAEGNNASYSQHTLMYFNRDGDGYGDSNYRLYMCRNYEDRFYADHAYYKQQGAYHQLRLDQFPRRIDYFTATQGGDCRDHNANFELDTGNENTIYPGAVEKCLDFTDQDCDGKDGLLDHDDDCNP